MTVAILLISVAFGANKRKPNLGVPGEATWFMVSDVTKCRIADHLQTPVVRALYLNDALESQCPQAVSDALTDIRASCFDENTIALPTFGEMSLAEALRILMTAGLALQVRPDGKSSDD